MRPAAHPPLPRRYSRRTALLPEAVLQGGDEVASILRAADETGLEQVPILAAYRGTGGPVATATFEQLRDEILTEAQCHADSIEGNVGFDQQLVAVLIRVAQAVAERAEKSILP